MIRLATMALAAIALPATASAQHIEFVGRVEVDPLAKLSQRSIGDARYVAMSELLPGPAEHYVEVLDLQTRRIERVGTSRAVLSRRFGIPNTLADGGRLPPHGELVSYQPSHAGLILYHYQRGPVTYVEVDARTGRLLRGTKLARVGSGQLTFVGTDPVAGAAWFVVIQADPQGTGKQAVLRRLDLQSLDVDDEVAVVLHPRTSTTGYEDRYFFHHATDFSRFAIVEYFEGGMNMSPGHVYILDPVARSSFAAPALSTNYAVAFGPDGKYVYLGSSDQGTIARLDLATQRIDKKVSGPRFMHELVVSPDGRELFALASSSSYTVLGLPGLAQRTVKRHATEVAPAMRELFGAGEVSLDRQYVILQDAGAPSGPLRGDQFPRKKFVIGRFVN